MNRVSIRDGLVFKQFRSPVEYEHEWQFYRDFGQYAPRVVKLLPEDLTIVCEAGLLIDSPTESHINQLASILGVLAAEGVHHRDVHPKNIVDTPDGVKLLDWETAIRHSGRSYDLCGPVDVPVPVQHGGLLPQWWESNDIGSIRNVWGVGIPEWAKQ